MKLITVNCKRPNDDDDDPRLGVTIAETPAEAEALCRVAYGQDGYDRFEVCDVLEGYFAGPARELGYAGQGAFSWKK